jgi:hypothetical protein
MMSTILREKKKALIPSLIVTGLAIIAWTMATPLDYAQAISPQPQQQPTTLSGIITSTQLNQAGVPEWLAAGSWKLVTDKPVFGGSSSNQTTTTKPMVKSFDAVIDMVMLSDGTKFHTHHISNFKQSDVLYMGNNVTDFNGTMTVTTENGPTENVPGFLHFQNNVMSVWVNPGKVGNHFGPTPINGIILTPEKLQDIRSLISEELMRSVQQQGNATMQGR